MRSNLKSNIYKIAVILILLVAYILFLAYMASTHPIKIITAVQMLQESSVR